jgi:RND family efflux transporter MFP subunit
MQMQAIRNLTMALRRFCFLMMTTMLVLSTACSEQKPPPEPIKAVRVAQVVPSTGQAAAEFAAEIRARTETRLGFRIPGKIVSRPVNIGDRVKVGQTLAELDPQDVKLGHQAAEAALTAARANHAQAQVDFDRFQALSAQGFISAAELARKDTVLTSAKAALEQAAAQARSQGNQASYAVLKADASGVVIDIDAEPGQVVSPGAWVVRLANDGPRDAVFSVPEDQRETMRALLGQTNALQVRLWGDAKTTLNATLREVAAAADASTRTYLAKAVLTPDTSADPAQTAVKLGQTAVVAVDVSKTSPHLQVPLSALVERQGKTMAWLLHEDTMTVDPVEVQVFNVDANGALIADGLQAGQFVVTAGTHVLTPGQHVKRYAAPSALPQTPTEGGSRAAASR